MRATPIIVGLPAVLVSLALVAGATHPASCVVTSADPTTYTTFMVGSRTFYLEDRTPPPYATSPPVPGSGFVFGEGTYLYEESNDIDGLQRGGMCGFIGCDWFPPGCDVNPDWQATDGTVPCLWIDEDPLNDEHCGHGPDTWVIVMYPGWQPWDP